MVGLENVDVTDKISGHMSYRSFMPLILEQLGFVVLSGYFDDPSVSAVCLVVRGRRGEGGEIFEMDARRRRGERSDYFSFKILTWAPFTGTGL